MRRVRYVVSTGDRADPVLLPVRLHVHFSKASANEEGVLTERGITLNDTHRTELQETVHALEQCVTLSRGVTIHTYGFASDEPF